MKAAEQENLPKDEEKVAEPEAPAAPEAELSVVQKALAEAVENEAEPVEGLDAEVTVALRRLAKGVSKEALSAAFGIEAPQPAEPADPLAALSDEAKALFKAANDKVEALAKQLADAKEEKELREAVVKAASDFPHLPEKPERLGPALRALAKADSASCAVLEDLLKKADALVANKLEPVGKSDPLSEASSSTAEKVAKMASDRVAKTAGKVKYESAYAQILHENPSLYTAMEAEKRESAKGN